MPGEKEREELQRLAYEAQLLQQQGQMITQRVAQLQEGNAQIHSAIEAIRGIGKGAKSFVPLGGGVLAPATLEGGMVLVELGAGTAAEMKPDEAVITLEARLKAMAALLASAEKDAGKAAQRLQAIDVQARGLMAKLNMTPGKMEE